MEIAHGELSLEERKIFACEVSSCNRSFTKKGNLTVHVRTVHEGEKRFACGETDLSSSKKVEGWNGEGCGKRYGSKLALEEHVRTAHLSLLNAKAERRVRMGQKKQSQARTKTSVPSTMSMLTGQGYAEESGRRISCFDYGCPHMFYRDYDLWVHMRSKHNLSEDDIQALFAQRAPQSHHESEEVLDGIYGLDLDTTSPNFNNTPYEPELAFQPSLSFHNDIKATSSHQVADQDSLFDGLMCEIGSTNDYTEQNVSITIPHDLALQSVDASNYTIPIDHDMNLAS